MSIAQEPMGAQLIKPHPAATSAARPNGGDLQIPYGFPFEPLGNQPRKSLPTTDSSQMTERGTSTLTDAIQESGDLPHKGTLGLQTSGDLDNGCFAHGDVS